MARDRETDASSVSRAIATLEGELGIRLFQRTTRKLVLTEIGTAYFERVVPLIEGLETAHSEAADLNETARGVLRVTASASFGQKVIVPLLPEFMRQHAQLSVELVLTDSVLDLLAERIDCAIRLGTLPDSSLVAKQLVKAVYRVCASPAYLKKQGRPGSPPELENHACLRFPLEGFKTRWIFRKARSDRLEIPVSGRVVISNALALEQCAAAGMGIALLPHWIVDDRIRSGALVDLFPEYQVTATDFNTAAWLVYPSRSYIPHKVRALEDYLKRALGPG